MASTKNSSKAKRPVASKKVTAEGKRALEKPVYKTLKLQKRIKHSNKSVIGSFKLMKANIVHLYRNWRLFLGISGVYFVLSLILVKGLVGNTDYGVLKESLEGLFTGAGGQISTGFTLFGVLARGGGTTISESGNVYQSLLLVLISLVVIWALRQTYAGVKVTIKEAFYKSMTPLVPFVLTLLVVGLQLVPLLLGSTLYAIVVTNGLAVTLVEQLLWAMLLLCVFVLTLYMVCSSIFALYIVTLPNVTPMQALRSARELVRYRRWSVMRKFIFLPIFLLLITSIIMIPILLYLTIVAQWMFIFLTMTGLAVVHGYIYRLYRELL